MNINLNGRSLVGALTRSSGILIFIAVGVLIGLVAGWQIFGQAAPGWIRMLLTWTVAMALLWCTVVGMTTGFAGSTSLDEFLWLLRHSIEKIKRGETISVAEALVLVACAIRSGAMLISAMLFIGIVFAYLHPMGG